MTCKIRRNRSANQRTGRCRCRVAKVRSQHPEKNQGSFIVKIDRLRRRIVTVIVNINITSLPHHRLPVLSGDGHSSNLPVVEIRLSTCPIITNRQLPLPEAAAVAPNGQDRHVHRATPQTIRRLLHPWCSIPSGCAACAAQTTFPTEYPPACPTPQTQPLRVPPNASAKSSPSSLVRS